jgi:(2Fe-2S) ferredoxin
VPKVERHFFVCANERPAQGKPSCGARGSAALITALQQGVGANPQLWGKVAVTPSGCLGPCFQGPTIVVYPEAVWYVGVTPADIPEIVESHMKNGVPVARLVHDWDAED